LPSPQRRPGHPTAGISFDLAAEGYVRLALALEASDHAPRWHFAHIVTHSSHIIALAVERTGGQAPDARLFDDRPRAMAERLAADGGDERTTVPSSLDGVAASFQRHYTSRACRAERSSPRSSGLLIRMAPSADVNRPTHD
jgi:hypothetical protein